MVRAKPYPSVIYLWTVLGRACAKHEGHPLPAPSSDRAANCQPMPAACKSGKSRAECCPGLHAALDRIACCRAVFASQVRAFLNEMQTSGKKLHRQSWLATSTIAGGMALTGRDGECEGVRSSTVGRIYNDSVVLQDLTPQQSFGQARLELTLDSTLDRPRTIYWVVSLHLQSWGVASYLMSTRSNP